MKQQTLKQIKQNVVCLEETKQTKEYVVNKLAELMDSLDDKTGIQENRCTEYN
jgi:hypothetical protein